MTDSALTVCIRELRRALGDTARIPQFIETVHGRGYRFLAPVTAESPGPGDKLPPMPATRDVPAFLRPVALVGREQGQARLRQWFTAAQHGNRQIVFIAGEPGIGKTALLETFVSRLAAEEDLWIGYGQCIEHYGAGEPYLPLLEALGRLCRGPAGAHFMALLRYHAPSWLAQMPALLTPAERQELALTTHGVPQIRMLRELTEALDLLTRERPLVLLLEDLHWSDGATVAWLTYVAHRRDQARLLVLGAYRPGDAMAYGHPLRTVIAELHQQGLCVDMTLDYLSEAAVATYVAQHCATMRLPPALPAALHQRTQGNPFFLRAVVDELVQHGIREAPDGAMILSHAPEVVNTVIPVSVRHMIEQQVERLPLTDQILLEAASVAGRTFAIAAVAAAIATPEDRIEARCITWARHGQFLQAQGLDVWPDGTVTACFRFAHDLYHEVIYGRVSAGRRARFHRTIGMRKEVGYGMHALAIAAELARHFEHARALPQALSYLRHAATAAAQHSAHTEAIAYLQRERALLARQPPSSAHTQQELTLYMMLGTSFFMTQGWAATEAEAAYRRAFELCRQTDDNPQYFPALFGLTLFHLMRGEYHKAHELGQEAFRIAQRVADHDLLLEIQSVLGLVRFFQGQFMLARTALEQGIALYDSVRHRHHAIQYGQDPGVVCLGMASWVLVALGYLDQAWQRIQKAVTLSQQLGHPHTQAFAFMFRAWVYVYRRDRVDQEQMASLMTFAQAQGFPHVLAEATIMHGWALAMQGQLEPGISQMRQGIDAYRTVGAEAGRTYLLAILAEAYKNAVQLAESYAVLQEAFATVTRRGEEGWQAELLRLHGELLITANGTTSRWGDAEACFHQALSLARRQQAKLYELRAAKSLARLWQQQGKRRETHTLLSAIYEWFTEGLETTDLREARALLEALT